MTQFEVNLIGGILLAALFYYLSIYRPKKLMRKPQDIQPLLKQANSLKLGEICYKHFSDQFYVCTQQPFSSLVYSPGLSKNANFQQEMHRLVAEAVLIDKKTRLPFAAIILSGKDDDRKGAIMAGVGVGCLIFAHVDDDSEIVEGIRQYLNEPEAQYSSATAVPVSGQ
ncbi:hypothetical protein C1N60_23210 (plasmid) [Pantoea sp. SGAir0184]